MLCILLAAAVLLRPASAAAASGTAVGTAAGTEAQTAAAGTAEDADTAASAQTVSSADLIDRAAELDGRTVTFTGEAVGDLLRRGSHVWVNLSDANNSAVGVYMSAADAAQIRLLGRYGVKGDVVAVTGVFQRACAEHGGDLDIHAERVTIAAPGSRLAPAVPAGLPALAWTSAAVCAALAVLAVFRVKRYNEDNGIRSKKTTGQRAKR